MQWVEFQVANCKMDFSLLLNTARYYSLLYAE
ncbi:hypothetical protein PAECIP111893_03304 [Paenibacillus plantiphilus]|uniref:Uncharacterized protein n=1 Tax=Paenibacillus plantiphilus TaxID=2905650 RepID=A0ABM9CDJ5_9BACL|nr:hypothetical protein PAECIP111893_03304 [Paenibacillus plantiphilus]